MSRSSAHRLRARLAGTAFDRLWNQALAVHARRMADPFAAPMEGGASPDKPRGAVVAPAARP